MTNYDIAQMSEGQKEILLAGMKLEQQRIINLLLDSYQHRDFEGVRLDNPHNDSLDQAVALIKGENK